MSGNLFSLIRARTERVSAPFIVSPTGQATSYEAAFAESAKLANLLVSKGVKPGDRVAVQVEKSARALMLYLACLRVGAVYLPLNTGYTLAEMEYFIGDAEPRVVVCDPAKLAGISALARELGVAHVETLDRNGIGTVSEESGDLATEFSDVERTGDDLAAILYTSGTTGRSKGAMLTHANLTSNASVLKGSWRFTADDVLLHALPIFHTHGLFVATNVTLMAGSSMVLLPKFDPDEIFRLLPGATTMMGVPTFYTRLLDDPRLTRETTANMRLFVSGSAPLLAETHRAWEQRTGHRILERYGMTETNMITSNPYEGERIPGSVGPALSGISVRVCDPETGAAKPAGEVGMIQVKGPNVFKGYWRMPEKTAAEFTPDGYFITGDLGKIDDNNYVSIVGRGKDLVISGGYNVYPKEVETEIDAMDGVFESAVIGVPHHDFGEGVTAVVVLNKGADLDEKGVLSVLESKLAKYKLPKRVLFVDALPRNTMGKVLKNELRQTYKDLYALKRAV